MNLPLIFLLLQGTAARGTAEAPVAVTEEPHHHVVFENSYVRVIEAVLPAGEATLFHTHTLDNVPVVVGAGKIAAELAGQPPKESALTLGQAWFAKAPYNHRVSNVGKTTVRFVAAEIIASPRKAPAASAVPEDHTLVLENDKLRIYRVALPAGTSRAPHAHGGAVLEVLVLGEPHKETGGRPRRSEYAWYESGAVPEVTNPGSSACQLVEIEWK